MKANKEELEAMIEEAFERLYEKDAYLVRNRPADVKKANRMGEMALVHRFAYYLENIFQERDMYTEYHVDCEYNRNYYNKKEFPSFQNGCYPDLIVHKRGSNQYNMLVMEFRTWWNRKLEDSRQKIKELVSSDTYKYQYGILVMIKKEGPELEWYLREEKKLKRYIELPSDIQEGDYEEDADPDTL